MFKVIPPDRGTDTWGSGYYRAPRGDRLHNGIDKLAIAGSQLLSLTKGKVTKLGYAYADDLSYRYIEIVDPMGNVLRYFYILPVVKVGQHIDENTILGEVQNLDKRYPGISNHFHFEVKVNNKYLDPELYLMSKIVNKG